MAARTTPPGPVASAQPEAGPGAISSISRLRKRRLSEREYCSALDDGLVWLLFVHFGPPDATTLALSLCTAQMASHVRTCLLPSETPRAAHEMGTLLNGDVPDAGKTVAANCMMAVHTHADIRSASAAITCRSLLELANISISRKHILDGRCAVAQSLAL